MMPTLFTKQKGVKSDFNCNHLNKHAVTKTLQKIYPKSNNVGDG